MNRSTVWRCGGVLAVLGVVGTFAVRRVLDGAGDFGGFHLAAERLVDGTCFPLEAGGNVVVARYPPWFGLLLWPYGLLPLGAAATLHFVVSAVALWRLPRLFERLTAITPRRQLLAWMVMAPFIVELLLQSQLELVLLFLAVTGLARLREGRSVSGGALVMLAALVNVLPGMLLLVPLALGRGRRAAAGALATVALFAVVVIGVGGADAAVEQTARWVAEASHDLAPWTLVETGRSLHIENQGLGVTLARSMGDLGDRAPRDVQRFLGLPLATVWTVFAALLVLLAVLVASGCRRARRGVGLDGGHGRSWLAVTALVAVGMLVVSPVVPTFAFVWLLPAAVMLTERPRLLIALGLVMAVGLAFPVAQGLGLHMACALFAAACVAWAARRDVSTPGAVAT